MCGIFAYIGDTKIDAQGCLLHLAHRGPDYEAYTEEGRVTLGHRRLAIIDLSAEGNQPMQSASGRTTITYNGEIYNYQALREILLQKGIKLRTKSDTEVILAGYEFEGVAFFERMRGMWAFAIHDREKQQLVLARDPFGIKPLFYTVRDGATYIASELRCLKRILTLEPDAKAFGPFYTLGYFPAPTTPYKGVYKMLPGEVRAFNLHDSTSKMLARTSRFAGVAETVSALGVTDYLDTILTDSVEAHYVADVPVSILLSGGTDSSLIAALSKKLGRTPTAYHVAIEGSPDTPYATAVAQHLNMDLIIEPLTLEALAKQYEKVWSVIDEPTGDYSFIPTSLVFERIKGHAKVVLSGEGGDEFFGGYFRHKTLASVPERLLAKAYARVVSLSRYPVGPAADVLAALYQDEYDVRTPPTLFFDLASYLPNDLLSKSDISSMASSIEVRVPFTDRWVATAAGAAFSAFGPPTGDKKLLKDVLKRYLPEELVERPKSGFGVSFNRYGLKHFTDDFESACAFHCAHRDAFGLPASLSLLLGVAPARRLVLKKYPRFAFALISNWKYFAV
jgi:asparagine synthase (glutamine-hydrolysing)